MDRFIAVWRVASRASDAKKAALSDCLRRFPCFRAGPKSWEASRGPTPWRSRRSTAV